MKNGTLNQRIFFNKYKIKKLIYQTKLSRVYEGINIKDKEPIALKLEKKSEHNLLESEAYFLFNLKGYGIPKIITYGISGSINVLVEELLGLSLKSLWESRKRYKFGSKLLIKDICMIAIQGLERLEFIHSKNIIHRDIKPHNFMCGKNNRDIIYLIDFGLAHKYRSSRTGKHIQYKFVKHLLGSLRYSSLNANRGYELSRRDDLESFGYMLVYLAKHYLPWISEDSFKSDIQNKVKILYKKKNSSTPEIICKGLPEEFAEFVRYTRNLKFEQRPNYDYLKNLFIYILIKNQQKNDFNFFWIEKKDKKHKNEDKKTPVKKRNSKNKLFNRLKLSLIKMNSQNITSKLNLKYTETKSEDKLNENTFEIKIEDNFKSYDINKIKGNNNNFNANEIQKYKYNNFDLNQNDNYKTNNINIIKSNDKCKKNVINLKNRNVEQKYINDVKNITKQTNKRILISPFTEEILGIKLNKKILYSPISSRYKKRTNILCKNIKERQKFENLNNLYEKEEINYNNIDSFNQIMFGKSRTISINSIKNGRIYDENTFKTFKCDNHNNYINLSSYNKPRNNLILITNNNTNYNVIKPVLKINNKRVVNISSNIDVNNYQNRTKS